MVYHEIKQVKVSVLQTMNLIELFSMKQQQGYANVSASLSPITPSKLAQQIAS